MHTAKELVILKALQDTVQRYMVQTNIKISKNAQK